MDADDLYVTITAREEDGRTITCVTEPGAGELSVSSRAETTCNITMLIGTETDPFTTVATKAEFHLESDPSNSYTWNS